jgi:2-polyprenyl-6-methoxyphenol hydroxylase-like FAD-dependent oxidoreductase
MTSMTGGIRTQAGVVLDVAIVGAGIAGLSAAIGLRHAGHQVEVRVFDSS